MPPVAAAAAVGFVSGGIGLTAAGIGFSFKLAVIGAALGAASSYHAHAFAPPPPGDPSAA